MGNDAWLECTQVWDNKYNQVHFIYEFWPSAFPTPHSFQNFHHLPPLVEMAFDFQNLRPGPTARPFLQALCSAVICFTIVGWKNQISLLLHMTSLPLHTYRLRSPDWGVYQAQLLIAGVLHMHLASTFQSDLNFALLPHPAFSKVVGLHLEVECSLILFNCAHLLEEEVFITVRLQSADVYGIIRLKFFFIDLF